jgi:quinol monooxygenase YgiN
MTVKILIKRKVKDTAMAEASKMLIQARTNALGENGYISSETLSNCDNPKEILVVSMWRSKADWDVYREDQTRMDFEREFEQLFESPTEYSVYNLGLSQ